MSLTIWKFIQVPHPVVNRLWRPSGGKVSVVSAVHEGADAIHAAFFEELVDDFPVCRVPPDEEDTFFRR